MALFDPCMEFENFLGQMTSFEVLLKCHSLTLSKKCLRLHPALSKCLSERINWIISRIPHRISKIIFVQGLYASLAMLEGKIRKCLYFYVKIFQNNSVTYKCTVLNWLMQILLVKKSFCVYVCCYQNKLHFVHAHIYILNYDAEDQKAMPQISSSLSFFVQLLLM